MVAWPPKLGRPADHTSRDSASARECVDSSCSRAFLVVKESCLRACADRCVGIRASGSSMGKASRLGDLLVHRYLDMVGPHGSTRHLSIIDV